MEEFTHLEICLEHYEKALKKIWELYPNKVNMKILEKEFRKHFI